MEGREGMEQIWLPVSSHCRHHRRLRLFALSCLSLIRLLQPAIRVGTLPVACRYPGQPASFLSVPVHLPAYPPPLAETDDASTAGGQRRADDRLQGAAAVASLPMGSHDIFFLLLLLGRVGWRDAMQSMMGGWVSECPRQAMLRTRLACHLTAPIQHSAVGSQQEPHPPKPPSPSASGGQHATCYPTTTPFDRVTAYPGNPDDAVPPGPPAMQQLPSRRSQPAQVAATLGIRALARKGERGRRETGAGCVVVSGGG